MEKVFEYIDYTAKINFTKHKIDLRLYFMHNCTVYTRTSH